MREREKERQTEGGWVGDKDRLSYWPITSTSLDHNPLCYLQDPLSSSSGGSLTRDHVGCCSSRALSVIASCSDPRLTLTPSDSEPHTGIDICHFITSMISYEPCGCFCLFTQVRPVQRNLSLTAHSRINMQQTHAWVKRGLLWTSWRLYGNLVSVTKQMRIILSYIYIYIYMRYNSIFLDAFADVIKVMNYIGLWAAELAWYSPSTTHLTCLYESSILDLCVRWRARFKRLILFEWYSLDLFLWLRPRSRNQQF